MENNIPIFNHRRGLRHKYNEIYKTVMPIIEKNALNPGTFIDALIDARAKETVQYNEWTIRCRHKRDDSAMFLIMSDDQVIAQFPIPFVVLNDVQGLKQLVNEIPSHSTVNNTTIGRLNISKLRSGMKSVTIQGTIQQISPKNRVITRWGTESTVANATITDGTGTIQFSLWNAQIDDIRIGDRIEIRNGYTVTFHDELQIRLGRKGSYGIIHQPSSDLRHDRSVIDSMNLSGSIEVSLSPDEAI